MDMQHGNDHGGMMNMAPPPSGNMMPHKKMMMHMSFYWGSDAEVIFPRWPGRGNPGMYVLSLALVFLLAFLVEWLSRSRLVKPGQNAVVSGILKTVLHGLRMGLAYMAMLAVMSFNVGIFIVAVLGHGVGYLVFGSGVFGSGRDVGCGENKPDLPPMSC